MRFFTSDTHLSHQNIASMAGRPWDNVDSMNQGLIDRWNDVVTDSDDVWVLGDFAMGKIAESLPLAEKLNGRKVLFPGNHDRCWKGNVKWADWVQRYEDVGFVICHVPVDHNLTTYIESTKVNVSHFPYHGDSHGEDRYTGFRPDNDGKWLIHGHTHSKLKVDETRTMIHVGVDAWDYTPVAESQIAEIIGNPIGIYS